MHLVTLTLVSPRGLKDGVRPEVLVDLLWAHAHPADGIQHLRAARSPVGIDVSAFSVCADDEPPDRGLHDVIQRAIEATPAMSNWHISAQEGAENINGNSH